MGLLDNPGQVTGLLDNPNQVTNSDPPKIHQLESCYIQQICGYKKIPAIVIHGNIQLPGDPHTNKSHDTNY